MYMKFHLLFFMSCFLLEEYVESQFMSSDCYPDTEQMCYKDSSSLEWPKTKTRYLLFTRKNKKEPEKLHLCNGTLPKNSNFNPNNRIVVFIPGFMFGACEISAIPEIKDKLLEKGDMNFIMIINTEEYTNDFLAAMGNTEKSANMTVKVLRNIQDKTGFKNENVYLIGHSLGAHVAGLIGQQFPVHRITGMYKNIIKYSDKTGFKNENVYLIGHSLGAHVAGLIGQQFPVHRITALDPAGVTYTKETPIDRRLDSGDADIVDVIHTNGGTGLPYLGAYFPMGDADFYVNGGATQPSCKKSAWEAAKNLNFAFVIGVGSVPSLCAHSQAIEYYKLSIVDLPGKFVAYACRSYKEFKAGNCTGDGARSAIMGYDFEDLFTPGKRRKYYIDTKKSWPFV